MDMCDIPASPDAIAVSPSSPAVTMILNYVLTQKFSGMAGQMQGGMKIMMWVMNLMFISFCFNAPIASRCATACPTSSRSGRAS